MTGLSIRDRALAVAALVGVAILVGLAVRPAPDAGSAAVPALPLVLLLDTGVWLVLAADILVTVAIVYALATDRRWLRPQLAKRHWTVTLASYLAPLAPTLLATALILYMRRANGARGALLTGLFGAGSARPSLGSNVAGSATSGAVTWASLVLAVLLVILFLGWLFWPTSRRKVVAERVTPPVPQFVSEAVDESLDALGAISDPRRAIIAAYAFMERSMSRVGHPRRAAETPLEFVARSLRAFVGVSSDLNRLTYLFELAKFSHHEIDEDMRSSAITALTAIRSQLIAAPSSAA